MHKIEKKLVAILICLLISSSILSATAITVQNDDFTEKSIIITKTKEVVTIYKYGPDGSVTPIEVEIEVNSDEDINDKIEEKCIELLKDDPELQELLGNNSTKQFVSMVKSRGRGFHIKLNPAIKWKIQHKIFPLLPPYKYRRLHIPIIFCKYSRDTKAYTTTTSLLTKETNTTTGPHSVLCVGFYGFKWWVGHIAWRGFLLRTGFVGFSIYTKINNL